MRRLLATLTAFFVLTAPASAAWTWPVSGDVITPYRNGTDPYATGQHRGIDIAAPAGSAVVAAAAGEVRFAGTAGSSGVTVSIRTGDGYDTSYLHLSSLAVRAGARVAAGDRVGAVGTTGTRSATEPHLHFGIRDAGTRHAYHDPLSFLPPPAVPPGAPNTPPSAAAPDPAPPAGAPAPAPRSAPVPGRGGARAPAPRTLPAPARGGAPAPAPRRAHMPAGGRTRVPHGAPNATPVPRRVPSPNGAPKATPARGGAPSPDRAPRPAPDPGGTPGLDRAAGHSLPALAPGAGRASIGEAIPARAASLDLRRHPLAIAPLDATPRATEAEGPDIGWALACAGLLLAAGILGLTESGRRSTDRGRRSVYRGRRSIHRGRVRLPGALRPLLGKR
jgi:Peptidase family M23